MLNLPVKFWLHNFTIRARSIAPIITVPICLVSVAGIMCVNDDSLVVCLFIAIPITLLAWIHGSVASFIVTALASLLVMPQLYPGQSLVNPPLTWEVWIGWTIGVMCLGYLVGVQGNLIRLYVDASAGSDIAPINLSPEYDRRYHNLLTEMQASQQRLQRMNEELRILNTITTAVSGWLDITQVETTALANISNLLKVDCVHLYCATEDHAGFVLQAARPMTLDLLTEQIPLPAHEGLLGRVMHSQRVEMLSHNARNLDQRLAVMGPDVNSVMAVPLRSRTDLLGVLVLGRKSGNDFTMDDESFLLSVGRVLAVAMENATLFKHTQDLSLCDELTGLGNRRMFNLRLSLATDRVALSGTPLCLAMFDLDHFKRVNDRHGHPAGDSVLRQFARAVQYEIRPTDLFCRFGGEEFALLVPDTTIEITASIAERICQRIATTPFVLDDGTNLPMTVSAGLACYHPESMPTSAELIAAADQALYTAKSTGRNRVITDVASAGLVTGRSPQ